MRYRLVVLLMSVLPLLVSAGAMPPSPSPHYVVDEAHVLSAATVQALDRDLRQYEDATTNQLVVAIYPSMPAEGVEPSRDIAAYGRKVFNAWGIGQRGSNNGV